MVVLCVLVFLSTIPIAAGLGMLERWCPRDDQSEFQVTYITPEGYTLERSNQVLSEIEDRLTRLPGVLHHFTVIGQSTGSAPARDKAMSRADQSIFAFQIEIDATDSTASST